LYSTGFTQYQLAKELDIDKHAVGNFFNYRRKKAGKRNCKLIRQWLIDHGLIVIKPRPRCTCSYCGVVHAMKLPFQMSRRKKNEKDESDLHEHEKMELTHTGDCPRVAS
jgi:hypothetical protein